MLPYFASAELEAEVQCSGSILIVLSLSTNPVKPAVTFVFRRGREIVNVVPPASILILDVESPAGAVAQSTEIRTRWSEVFPGGVSVPDDGVAVTQVSDVTLKVEVVFPFE